MYDCHTIVAIDIKAETGRLRDHDAGRTAPAGTKVPRLGEPTRSPAPHCSRNTLQVDASRSLASTASNLSLSWKSASRVREFRARFERCRLLVGLADCEWGTIRSGRTLVAHPRCVRHATR